MALLGKLSCREGTIIRSAAQYNDFKILSFFKKQILQEKINTEKIDVTLTSYENETGTLHPLSRTVEELCAIFADMGFVVDPHVAAKFPFLSIKILLKFQDGTKPDSSFNDLKNG